jgi:hypothetical protein
MNDVTVFPDLTRLFSEFPLAADLPAYELIPAEAVPPPFHGLLVHNQHMTVTVEAYHGDLVDVRVLARRRQPPYYARKIVLPLRGSGKIVLFGIVRVNLDYCAPDVREEILAEKTPFGRVLIQHDVLRRIEPTAYLRIEAGPAQRAWFGLKKDAPLYGRLAIIHCDERPAVELLEVVVS